VSYSEEQGQWRVAGPTAGFGTFDTKQAALTKARQVYTRDEYDGLLVETKDGGASVSQSVGNTEVSQTPDRDTSETGSDEPGRFQQFATGFATKVNETVAGSGAEQDNQASQEDTGNGTDPMAALFGGGGGGGGGGDGGPMLPGMAGESEDDADGAQGPMLRGFGGSGEGRSPMLPGMMGDTSEADNQPQMPFGGPMAGNGQGLFMQDDRDGDEPEDDQPPQFPWM